MKKTALLCKINVMGLILERDLGLCEGERIYKYSPELFKTVF